MDTVIAVVAAIIAAISAAISYYQSKKSLHLGELSHELDRQAQDAAERSVALAGLEHQTQRIERIRNWGDDAVEALVRLRRLCETSPSEDEYLRDRDEACTRVSYHVEQGRLFFPNTMEGAGRPRRGVREGHRQPILDPLVDAYRAMSGTPFAQRADQSSLLLRAQEQFVAALDGVIAPERPLETYSELLRSHRRPT